MLKLVKLAHQKMHGIERKASALANMQALERLRVFRKEEQRIICQVWKSRGSQALQLWKGTQLKDG